MALTIPILMLVPYAPRGMLAPQILRALTARGFDPAIVVCESGAPAYQDDPFEDFEARGRLHDMKGQPTSHLRELLQDICEGKKHRRPKLIVQVGAYRLYPWLAGIKEEHPEIAVVDLLYNPIGHTVDHFLYERAFDAVLVESQFMQRFIRKASDQPDKEVLIVRSGVDLERFSPGFRRAQPDALTLGYVGRMSSEKNPLGFLDLAEALGARLPMLRFYMAGGGPQLEDVKARGARSPIRDRLEVAAYVEDVRDAFCKIDILVTPSKADGRPVAVMEANAMGRPVLAAPVGGLPEMIQNGVNGWALPPTDVEGVASAIAPLVADDAILENLMRGARGYAEKHFNYDAMLEAYSATFRRLVSRNHAGVPTHAAQEVA